MDESTFLNYLNTLKEIILDEERLVTYVSLSKELCVHVNDSKALMSRVVDDIKQKQPSIDLNVCFIISGLSVDNKARTTVCSEKEKDKLKKSLCSVFFEHIYSICKGQSVVDNFALLAVNTFDDFPLCTGVIKNIVCGKRTMEEIGSLKSSSQVVDKKEPKSSVAPKKMKEETEELKINVHNSTTIAKVQESKSEPVIKESTSPKKSVSSYKTNGHVLQKGIVGFFSKSISAPAKPISNTNTEKGSINIKKDNVQAKENSQCRSWQKLEVKAEKMDVDGEIDIKTLKEVKHDKPSKEKFTNSKPKTLNSSLDKIKKNAKIDKKRKRVLNVSDSESDEDQIDPFVKESVINDDSEDEIPPTPNVNTVKITSGIVNPKKRRKIVDKTYIDEDGYVMTKKEEVYESCSDAEDTSVKENIEVQVKAELLKEASPKKNAPKSKKKVSPVQTGNQPTMMSFFKKV